VPAAVESGRRDAFAAVKLRAVVTGRTPSLFERLWLAWVTWFRVVFDGAYAGRVLLLRENTEKSGVDSRTSDEGDAVRTGASSARNVPAAAAVQDLAPARMLLRLFQREGRFVDFLQQDITSFADADVGAAARVVHEGCRRVLRSHAKIGHARSEAEGTRLTLDAAAAEQVKLVGQVSGKPPYNGVLRHAGWRIDDFTLPVSVGERDPALLAEPEVELS
jgi:hypothetical protein